VKKEALMAYFKVLFRHLFEITDGNTKS